MDILGPLIVILLVVSGVPFVVGMLIGYILGKSRGKRLATATSAPVYDAPSEGAPSRYAPQGYAPPDYAVPKYATSEYATSEYTASPLPPPAAPAHQQYPGAGHPPPPAAPAQQPHQGAGYPPPSYWDIYEPSPEEREAERKRRENRGINIALYIGGLLLTAAALLFTAAVADPFVIVLSLTLAFLAFAGGGLLLALLSDVLKPAGVALFGTSLALLPIMGVPLNEAVIGQPALTWLLLSAVGLGVYGYGAVALDSRVLGYLVIPFLYSSILAGTAALQVALLWTLLVIIAISALVQVAVLISAGWVPRVLRVPFGMLHPMVVPGVLIAALLLVEELLARDYALLFLVSALYYALASALPGSALWRLLYRLASRVLATLAVVAVLIAAEVEAETAGLVLSVWAVLVYLLVSYVPGASAAPAQRYGESLDGADVLRADRLSMLIAAVICGIGFQLPQLTQAALDGRGQSFLGAQVGLTLGVLSLAVLTRAAPPMLLRAGLAAALLLALPHAPYYGLLWAGAWVLAEFKLSVPPDRSRWQRAVGLAAGAAAGLTAGVLAGDSVLGDRLALLLVAGIAAITAALLVVLLRTGRAQVEEAWAYLGVFVAGGIAGTQVLAIADGLIAAYFSTVMVVAYGLLSLAPGPAGGRARGAMPALRAALFAASLLLAVLLLGALDPEKLPDAWIVFGVASVLLVAECGAAAVHRGTGASASFVYRWAPVHLAANLAWLAGVNAALATSGADADLYWFTAVSWAVTYGVFAVGAADRRILAVTTPSQDRPVRSRDSYDRVLGGAYALGAGSLAAASMLLDSGPGWVHFATGAGAVLVGMTMLLTSVSREESAVGAPAFAALGAALLGLAALDALEAAQATVIYLVSLISFCSAAVTGAAGLVVVRSIAQAPRSLPADAAAFAGRKGRARRQLAVSASVLAFGLSLVPATLVAAGDAHALAWLVPAMHLALLWPAIRVSRHGGAIAGSLVVPLSMFWAWYQWDRSPSGAPGDAGLPTVAAGAMLLMIVALLLSEALIGLVPGRERGHARTAARWWPPAHYAAAGAVTLATAALGLGSGGALERLAPILAATMLILGGLIRSIRPGIYIGAVVIVLAVLRWLSQWMFLFLVFLGALIIAVAIWRLVAGQRRGQQRPPGAGEGGVGGAGAGSVGGGGQSGASHATDRQL